MRTISYKLDDLKKIVIPIGFEGENDHTRVIIDAGEVFAQYPSAAASLRVKPPQGSIYPVVVNRDGDRVIWNVKDTDCASDGNGEAQFTFTENNVIVKSVVTKIKINRSLTVTGPAPDPIEDWLDAASETLEEADQAIEAATNAAAAAEATAEDLKALDDITKAALVGDVGKALSPKTVENGVVTEWQFVEPGAGTDDYADLDNKPSIAGVTLSGNKTLEDLGIAADDDLDNLADEVSDVKNNFVISEDEPQNIDITWDTEGSGKYIGSDGTIGSSANFHYSDLISVSTEDIYNYSFSVSGVNPFGARVHGYNENGEWVKQIAYQTDIESGLSLFFQIDSSSIKYIRISTRIGLTNEKLLSYDANTIRITWDTEGSGKYIGSDGTIGSSASFHYSELLNVELSKKYIYSFKCVASTPFGTRIHGYNSNGEWVKQITNQTQIETGATLLFEIDDSRIKYIRISNKSDVYDETLVNYGLHCVTLKSVVLQMQNEVNGAQWKDKKWFGYGTSITNVSSEGKYATYLAKMSGLVFTNKGISGGGIGNLGAYSQGQVYSAICNITDGKLDADLITLETGANDCNSGVPLGTIYDTGTSTLAGCLNDCIRYLQKYTNAQICIINSPASTNEPNASSQYYEWADMVRRICDINRVHFLNNNSNMGYAKISDSTKGSMYVVDTIHQTELGGFIMAQNLWYQLRNIPLFYTTMPS